MKSARLFIASLGNPSPHLTTRHSAGHVLLRALQSHLNLPSLKKSKSFAGGLVSLGADVGRPELTLWHSPSLMNISGVALLKAYKQFLSNATPAEGIPGLVILHDEMETAPGRLKVRHGATSARGHNGIKSVQQSLLSAGLMGGLADGASFVKVGIGIGRPAGGTRERDEVSDYVLGQLRGEEK
ncbi:peptidyl-tRNA hydrolase, partial [Pseudomassariella vexata]